MKESLTHLPPSWLRPPTPIPRTHRRDTLLSPSVLHPSSSTFHPSLLHFHQLPPHRPSLSSVTHLLSMPGWLLLPLAAACQVACRRTKSSPTLQSLYIHGVPNVLSPSSSFCLSASHSPFQPTPLRGTRTPILIVAREPSLPERLVPAYDPDGARCK